MRIGGRPLQCVVTILLIARIDDDGQKGVGIAGLETRIGRELDSVVRLVVEKQAQIRSR